MEALQPHFSPKSNFFVYFNNIILTYFPNKLQY
nr:MAG TPA: hypothetical protein [Caudoviricetes sp.]